MQVRGPKEEEMDEQEKRIVGVIGEVCVAGLEAELDTADSQLNSLSGMNVQLLILVAQGS